MLYRAESGREERGMYKKGIDVSRWQGTIDWEKVKAAGIEFAMLRAGYGQGNIDGQFARNANECTRLGIPFGAYWFSYAYTPDMARREARFCIDAVKGYKLSYPLAYDFEYDSVDYASERGVSVTKALASSMARAFCEEIRAGGYYPMVYANPNYLAAYFDAQIPQEYDIWLAQWPGNPNPEQEPAQAGGMWQYSSRGSVGGIEGRVDLDAAYKDYPALTAGESEGGEDTDKDSPYEQEAERARAWVEKEGISDGSRPDDYATRQEVWVMLYRLEGYK